MELDINGEPRPVPPDWREETLLSVLRELLGLVGLVGLVGAKFGCGVGLCGACTVLLDDLPVRSCMLPVREVGARRIVTVEGLSADGRLHPVEQAWLAASVPQCGYCQTGQMMSTVALLRRVPRPTDAEIDEALAGHLCRCGTQHRIRQGVRLAAGITP